jgi:TfoX/Sxy family transcriptional regulator of competence genes
MASDQEFVDFVLGQIDTELELTYRKMFGEYQL